tara:strand:+ start:697 stop:897 length:201 start_codon:yes stop_codon:yes gene_type:complete
MKTIVSNLKNLIPYLFLISLYFFFVNIEARKDKYLINTSSDIPEKQEINIHSNGSRIKIPVIPYNY